MTKERLMQSIKVNLLKGEKRTAFMKTVFAEYGEGVSYFPKIMPLYPKLIKFGNNIVIASGVNFITHDAIHAVLNNLPGKKQGRGGSFKERVGCIEIGDNVFIGANSTILYNVRIGFNVIVGSETLILNDLEDNGVYAGIPARKISSFEDFVKNRIETEPKILIEKSQFLSEEEKKECWELFYKSKVEWLRK